MLRAMSKCSASRNQAEDTESESGRSESKGSSGDRGQLGVGIASEGAAVDKCQVWVTESFKFLKVILDSWIVCNISLYLIQQIHFF